MTPQLEAELGRRLGTSVKSARRLGGGDINEAYSVMLQDGEQIFVKTHPKPPRGMYEAEAHGLRWLGEAGAIRIPSVISFSDDDPAYLALEMVEPAERISGFDEELGRSLARLHRHGAPFFGLDRDNFIGRLHQRNTRSNDWAAFYWSERLEPQIRLAVDRGHLDSTMQHQLESLESILPNRVASDEPPSRLHGDLWGGNLHVDERGHPCLIDPAAYGGHREIDLAMMQLFGGFGARVFDAYAEAWPLPDGAEDRVPVYQLYPLLVHVNLFGGTYVSSVSRALEQCI
jgi:fructosamine-3-kinase